MEGLVTYLGLYLGGYLVGSFPTGVVLTRTKYRIDVREMGSGNIGATNVTRSFGWYAGGLTFLIDFLKGYLPVFYLQQSAYGSAWAISALSLGLVFGHCYSLFLKFNGGKGVATSFGVLLVLFPNGAVIALVTFLITLALKRIPAIASLMGVGSFLLYLTLTQPTSILMGLCIIICAVVTVRHRVNISRLLSSRKQKA